ncbi:hypothetical protein PanWU01x14_114160, partial [Parasponia andersonii]
FSSKPWIEFMVECIDPRISSWWSCLAYSLARSITLSSLAIGSLSRRYLISVARVPSEPKLLVDSGNSTIAIVVVRAGKQVPNKGSLGSKNGIIYLELF